MSDEIIEDGENFRDKSVGNYREIVINQVKKIVTIYSQEMIDGFFKYSQPNKYGLQEKIGYVSDGHLAYSQAVDALEDLLNPKFDLKTKEKIKEIKDKRKDNKGKKKRVKYSRLIFRRICLYLESVGWLEEKSYTE
jgi:hypothetical protein